MNETTPEITLPPERRSHRHRSGERKPLRHSREMHRLVQVVIGVICALVLAGMGLLFWWAWRH
jgi:hypothetical protein